MNLIELTCVLTVLSGLLGGAVSGKDVWGIVGLLSGAICGFAIGLGIAFLLGKADQLTLRWGRTDRGAILSIALGFGMAFLGPPLSAASAFAVTLLINRVL